jgi:hypothetical protein
VRPKTIVYFERIIFGTLLLSALQIYLGWDLALVEAAPSHPDLAVSMIEILITEFVLPGTLTLLVSCRRSKIAMWVLIVWFALNIWSVAPLIIGGRLLTSQQIIRTALKIIGQVAACSLLFTPSARRWINREDEKNEKLREVFE